MLKYNRESAVQFGPVDTVKFAESFGAKGFRVEHSDQFIPLLKEAMAIKGPVLIEVPIDYSDNPELFKLADPTVGELSMSDERYQKGIEEMRRHLGVKADEYVENIREIAPEFARVNVEFAFGDLYARGGVLDQRTRELATVAALTVMGHALPELKIHIEAALRCGATKEEVIEVITQMLAYCGFPAATNAILLAKEVFSQEIPE